MNIPKETELNTNGKRSKPYLKKHYPEFVAYLETRYPHVNKFCAAVYLYYRNMEHPKCPVCGNPTPFLDITRGFQRCCSSKCANSDPQFRAKVRSTNLQRYGVEHASQCESIKAKIVKTTTERYGGMGNAADTTKDKQYNTMVELYGAEHALSVDKFNKRATNTLISKYGGRGAGSQEIHKRIQKTCIKKYGVDHYTNTPEMHEKSRLTNLQRYGVEYATQNKEIADKISQSKLKSFADIHDDIIVIEKKDKDIYYVCKCPHPECKMCEAKQYRILAPRYCDRRLDGTEPCTNLLPVVKGRNKGTSIELFVLNIIKECNVDPNTIKTNYFRLIPPKEVDIYDPIRGFAFECNGCYWHSDEKKSPTYHLKKYKECQAKGIQLITIWEDWVINKPEIVRSIIRAKYNYFEQSYYARRCHIREITGTMAGNFYDVNHIQGRSRAQIHYGLYYEDELIAAMSFSKMRSCMGVKQSKDGQWELVRFCSKLNTQIIGGGDKLLKYFIRHNHPQSIVSFSSNDISNGSLYEKLGFIKSGENTPYWYIGAGYKRYHRSNFTKAAIVRMGMAPDTSSWTESEAMMLHGFIRIYDSGQTKWVLNLSK